MAAGEGTLAGWKARLLISKAASTINLPGWEEDPFRTRRQVFDALYSAIELAGGRRPRTGGYRVSALEREE